MSASARVRVAGPIVTAILAMVPILGLAACAQPVTGTSTPAATTKSAASSAPPMTVVESTVVVAPPETVTVQPAPVPRTPCQQLYADGYSYDATYLAWETAGYPSNWDADSDGFPCEQSYGDQN
jgi:hypothetical protein